MWNLEVGWICSGRCRRMICIKREENDMIGGEGSRARWWTACWIGALIVISYYAEKRRQQRQLAALSDCAGSCGTMPLPSQAKRNMGTIGTEAERRTPLFVREERVQTNTHHPSPSPSPSPSADNKHQNAKHIPCWCTPHYVLQICVWVTPSAGFRQFEALSYLA